MSSEELAKKEYQLERLYQISLCLYSVISEEDLFQVLKDKLPNLCNVDRIECLNQNTPDCPSLVYSYPCLRISTPLSIHFYTKKGVLKAQLPQLKKTGQILENVLLRIERHQQLTDSKKQWELAFDTINTPLCLISPDGKILRTNKAFRDETQMSKTELFQKDYFYTFFKRYQTHFSRRPKKTREVRSLLKNKKQVFEVFTQEVTQNTRHKVQLIILKDITQQIQIEEKLARTTKSSELKIISKSIAHELNNPIGGIYLLLQSLHTKQKHKPFFKDIHEMLLATKRCIQIINELLNHSSKTCRKSGKETHTHSQESYLI